MAGFSAYKTSKATLGSSAGDSNGLKFATGINTADSLRADSIGTALATFASIIGDSHAEEWIESGYGVITIDEKGTYRNGDSIDGGGGGSTKIEPTLTLDKNYGTITYNGDGELFAKLNASYQYILDNNNNLTVRNASGNVTSSYSVTIYASEGENYAAKTFTF